MSSVLLFIDLLTIGKWFISFFLGSTCYKFTIHVGNRVGEPERTLYLIYLLNFNILSHAVETTGKILEGN